MMRAWGAVVLLTGMVTLAGCGSGTPAAPADRLTPEPLAYPDIIAGKLVDAGCNFAADDAGMSATLLAQPARAVFKLAGKLVTVPADTGSAPLPQHSWTHYRGAGYDVRLSAADGKHIVNGVIEMVPLRLTIAAEAKPDDVLYAAHGTAQCKPM